MKARYLYRALKARYRNERRELRAILACLKPGDVAVDVGAHKGSYVYWLRRAVGAQGTVFAFEPQPTLAAYLRSVCAVMNWKNVAVGDCALSDRIGTGVLHVAGGSTSPGASLEAVGSANETAHSCECRVDTLDHALQEVRRVNLLKVDVEGHELGVFRGGYGILSRDRPTLVFECERRHLRDHSMEDVFAFLERLGYEGEFFSPTGLLPLKAFDPKIHQRDDSDRFWDAPGYCNNFLFRAR